MKYYSQIEVLRNGQWVEPCGSDQQCYIDGRLSRENKQAMAQAHAVRYAKFHKEQARALVKRK